MLKGCFIRISKILLYAIHNLVFCTTRRRFVVLSGFQRYFCMQYTTRSAWIIITIELFYQDFKDTFVCNTQLRNHWIACRKCCFIRISKILLYAIHNIALESLAHQAVVLSGFQRYFCMQYTTMNRLLAPLGKLFYQDFKDTFVCNTQHHWLSLRLQLVVLSGFQRYFCMQYTTSCIALSSHSSLFYQDFKDTFVCNTQL